MKKYYNYNGRDVTLQKEAYRNNGTLAVIMTQRDGSTYGVATVNLCHPLQSDTTAFLDENNLPGIGKWIEANGLGKPTGLKARSGYCEYPLYTLFT